MRCSFSISYFFVLFLFINEVSVDVVGDYSLTGSAQG
jgi:hypothetical protein